MSNAAEAAAAAVAEAVAATAPGDNAEEAPKLSKKAAKAAKAATKAERGEAYRQGKGKLPYSALFEQVYKGHVIPEAEWPDFLAILAQDLPVTFRFAAGNLLASALEAYMEREFLAPGALDADPQLAEQEAAAQPKGGEPLARLAWVPRGWKLDMPKAVLRKAAGPKRLHNLLKKSMELGAISRQEAVSMVPALLLRSRSPGMRVLDLCAAPGMKTLQLIDMAAETASNAEDGKAAILQAGVVVANELDGRRCCMLAHHVLKARSPAGIVLHHNALAMPAIGNNFDRVLCDVPCSGDGTIRKAPQLLGSWRPNKSSVLHRLQLHIACAGASRLAEGGRMIYSTCTMSPVENEAVVAALLLRAEGALELLDVSGELPELPRRPGMESWEVAAGARQARTAVFLRSTAEAAERTLDIPASAWPPSGDAAEKMGLPGILTRCWRLYPHLCDSGGFFVAVLRRVEGKPLPEGFCPPPPSKKEKEESAAEGADAESAKKAEKEEELDLPEDAVCKEELPSAQREASYASAASNERSAQLIKEALEFYGLDALPADNFFVRNDGDGRNVYLVSDGVRDILDRAGEIGLRALIAGVRVFDENRFLKASHCRMRLCQEGAQWLEPYMRRRRCPATPSEMLRLLDGTPLLFKDLPESSALRQALEAVDTQGSVAIVADLPRLGGGGDSATSASVGDAPPARLCAVAERGAECVSLFVKQDEMRELREAMHEFWPDLKPYAPAA